MVPGMFAVLWCRRDVVAQIVADMAYSLFPVSIANMWIGRLPGLFVVGIAGDRARQFSLITIYGDVQR